MSSQQDKWKEAFKDPEKRRWLFGYSKTRIVDLMLDFLKENEIKITRVLDVGCGSGRNAITLAKMGFEVYGIDFLEKALDELVKRVKKENVSVKTVYHDITLAPWPLKSDFFDAAIINVVLDSIEYLGRKIVARELYRVLRKNGYLFIYEPSINDGYYGQFVKDHKNPIFVCPDDGIRREIFTPDSLVKPFKSFFRVISIEERTYNGKMFGRRYKRSWLYCILQKI